MEAIENRYRGNKSKKDQRTLLKKKYDNFVASSPETLDQTFDRLQKLISQLETQAGSKSRPPMLNKENYVPWSYRLLRYAKSRPNGKLIHKSILNGPYVKRMIPEPGDVNRETILLGLPEDIYAVVDSCETAQEI
nr:hypothetical protein [Tanacetum cinerariifolium]